MNTYCNPIKRHGDFADPFVLRYNGKYYLYATNPDVRCWSSDDLVNWKPEGATVPEEEFPGLVPFAPEVVRWNGAFYMYTSPHGFGHYVLKSDSPTGPFRKITGNIGRSIDFSVFIDDDGRWYAYRADDRGIVGCKMDSPTEFGEEVLIGAYLHGWTEGPFVVKKDGKYHLTYTGNHFLSKGYRINAAVSDSPLGPYRDDPYNPVIVCTEGNVVGLGHSCTVLGPDLHTHYIVYHNLNPDKTRDLNIDPVVFTQERAYILGPTATPRPAPALPQWRRLRPVPQSVHRAFAEDVTLPGAGAAEFHMAAGEGIARYGISFTGADDIRLELDRAENTISVKNRLGLVVREKLLKDYDHEALHCIRVEYGGGLSVYMDNLLRLKANVSLGGCGASYYADGQFTIGSAAAHSADKETLHYPVPCLAPGSREICFDVTTRGTYQLLALECKACGEAIRVDGNVLPPDCVDRESDLAFYRCDLTADSHTLQMNAETVAIAPYYGSGCDAVSVRNIGPYDKVCGREKWSNGNISADLTVADCGEGWQAGVIFRAEHLADGGEGGDKRLGTNFFVGYRVCISEDRLQLWKHRYDETLLGEIPYDGGSHVSLQIIAAGNMISLRMNGKVILEYRDRRPILYGYVGFHARNCIITSGTIAPFRPAVPEENGGGSYDESTEKRIPPPEFQTG
ncbi:MAG TPA: hypothetical protein DDY81_01590 [Clostridiales bacterium]|nr:hypothetical protein [Clostridiales bacterium]